MKPVQLEDGRVLLCGGCGNNFVHHKAIAIYTRHEDETKYLKTVVADHKAISYLVERDASNPSSRRDGITIEFECENCSSKPRLMLVQHKGQTFVEWDK